MSKDYSTYLNGIGIGAEEQTVIVDYVKELFEIAMATMKYKTNIKEDND